MKKLLLFIVAAILSITAMSQEGYEFYFSSTETTVEIGSTITEGLNIGSSLKTDFYSDSTQFIVAVDDPSIVSAEFDNDLGQVQITGLSAGEANVTVTMTTHSQETYTTSIVLVVTEGSSNNDFYLSSTITSIEIGSNSLEYFTIGDVPFSEDQDLDSTTFTISTDKDSIISAIVDKENRYVEFTGLKSGTTTAIVTMITPLNTYADTIVVVVTENYDFSISSSVILIEENQNASASFSLGNSFFAEDPTLENTMFEVNIEDPTIVSCSLYKENRYIEFAGLKSGTTTVTITITTPSLKTYTDSIIVVVNENYNFAFLSTLGIVDKGVTEQFLIEIGQSFYIDDPNLSNSTFTVDVDDESIASATINKYSQYVSITGLTPGTTTVKVTMTTPLQETYTTSMEVQVMKIEGYEFSFYDYAIEMDTENSSTACLKIGQSFIDDGIPASDINIVLSDESVLTAEFNENYCLVLTPLKEGDCYIDVTVTNKEGNQFGASLPVAVRKKETLVLYKNTDTYIGKFPIGEACSDNIPLSVSFIGYPLEYISELTGYFVDSVGNRLSEVCSLGFGLATGEHFSGSSTLVLSTNVAQGTTCYLAVSAKVDDSSSDSIVIKYTDFEINKNTEYYNFSFETPSAYILVNEYSYDYVEIGEYFYNKEGFNYELLSLSVSDTSVVSAFFHGTTLIMQGLKEGECTVTATLSFPDGEYVETSKVVTVGYGKELILTFDSSQGGFVGSIDAELPSNYGKDSVLLVLFSGTTDHIVKTMKMNLLQSSEPLCLQSDLMLSGDTASIVSGGVLELDENITNYQECKLSFYAETDCNSSCDYDTIKMLYTTIEYIGASQEEYEEAFVMSFKDSVLVMNEGEITTNCLVLAEAMQDGYSFNVTMTDSSIVDFTFEENSTCATITALKAGKTTVEVSSSMLGKEVKTSMTITVIDSVSLYFNETAIVMTEGEITEVCFVKGESLTDATISMTMSDTSIVNVLPSTISTCAPVEALQAGETTITLSAFAATGKEYTTSITVTVNPGTSADSTFFYFEESEIVMTEGETREVCFVESESLKDTEVEMAMTNTSVVNVVPGETTCATVEALQAGETTITLTSTLPTGKEYTASITVTVNPGTSADSTFFYFEESEIVMTEGETREVCFVESESLKDTEIEMAMTNTSVVNVVPGETTCATVEALQAGKTTVTLTSTLPTGKEYTASITVTVNPANVDTSMTLRTSFVTLELKDESLTTECVVVGSSLNLSNMEITISEEEVVGIEKLEDGCYQLFPLSVGSTMVKFAIGTVSRTLMVVVEPSQIEPPQYNSNVIDVCYSNDTSDLTFYTLEEFVYATSGVLRWYDVTGKILTSAPLMPINNPGTHLYYVSQIPFTEESENYRESEKVLITVNVKYISSPTTNIFEQKICDNEAPVPFVASIPSTSGYYAVWSVGNAPAWKDVTESEMVSYQKSYTPSSYGDGVTYLFVYTADSTSGCISEPTSVILTKGNSTTPIIHNTYEMEVDNFDYVVNEQISLTVTNLSDTSLAAIWSLGNDEYIQSETISLSYSTAGTYDIKCNIIDKNSGCTGTASKTLTIEDQIVSIESIAVNPESLVLYEGESSSLSLSISPTWATNQSYHVEIEDVNVADVSGLTIFAVAEGQTEARVYSDENPDIADTVSISVKKYVASRSISMPSVINLEPKTETNVNAVVIPSNASYNEVFFNAKTDAVISVDAQGQIKAIGEGTSIITAYTKDGLYASAIVNVTSAVETITDIKVPDSVSLRIGDSVVVQSSVLPVTAILTSSLIWETENQEVATCVNGKVFAKSAGTTMLTVSYGEIEKQIEVIVTSSDAPVIASIPEIIFEQGGKTQINLANYIYDDETSIEDLTIEIKPSNEGINIDTSGSVVTISASSTLGAGVYSVEIIVTDSDGQTQSVIYGLTIEEKLNEAPIILLDSVIALQYNSYLSINLSDIAVDDYTLSSDLNFEFEAESVVSRVVANKTLSLISTNPDVEQDYLTINVMDGNGLMSTKQILLSITKLPNQAPEIAEIPVQNETDVALFTTINLSKYVTDDYTPASSIKWTAASSNNLSISIATSGIATVKTLNSFWNGAESVLFYAKDEEGLTDSVEVYFVRDVTIEETTTIGENKVSELWTSAPTVDIATMRYIGVPGDVFVLMGSCSGYGCSWNWTIDGATGIDQSSLMQMVTFDKPGTYSVTLTVQYSETADPIVVTKENFLTVVGIAERNPSVCKGQAITLHASEGLSSYYWSTNEASSSITSRPLTTTTYKVSMKKGLFTLVDTVRVEVSEPVTLIEDSVSCAGTSFELEAQGEYNSYVWNTGSTTKSISVPSEVKQYVVTTIDKMNCISQDTFNLTKVNSLPVIDLGEDQTPCDGDVVKLDAGSNYEYLWSTGSTEQKVSLDSSANIWVRIVDANECVNSDTIDVAFKYPYTEQLGVVTFSETSSDIIIAWEKTAYKNTVSYRVERETDVTDNWEQVGEDVLFSEPGLIVDGNVNYEQRAYKYRLVTTDGCDNEAISEVHRSMHLVTTLQPDGKINLLWTAYEPMENVTQYLVLSGVDESSLDTVDRVPASNAMETWSETNSFNKDMKYKVVFRLKDEVNENRYKDEAGNVVDASLLKAESGPFSLAMSNLAEAENATNVDEIAFPADIAVYPTVVKDVVNVAIVSSSEETFVIEIINTNGQIIKRIQTGAKSLVQIPLETIAQGTYNVKISNGEQSKSIKIVK